MNVQARIRFDDIGCCGADVLAAVVRVVVDENDVAARARADGFRTLANGRGEWALALGIELIERGDGALRAAGLDGGDEFHVAAVAFAAVAKGTEADAGLGGGHEKPFPQEIAHAIQFGGRVALHFAPHRAGAIDDDQDRLCGFSNDRLGQHGRKRRQQGHAQTADEAHGCRSPKDNKRRLRPCDSEAVHYCTRGRVGIARVPTGLLIAPATFAFI